jgi:hypothetical protein
VSFLNEDKIILASRARELMDNPLLKEALEKIEAEAIREARSVPWFLGRMGDRRRRRALEKANMVLEFRRNLMSHVNAAASEARKRVTAP